MRIYKRRCGPGFGAYRRSMSFFELYGRAPPPEVEEKVMPQQEQSSSSGHLCQAMKECTGLLNHYHSRRYINTHHVPESLCRETLASIVRVLVSSPERHAATVQNLWTEALELVSHLPAHDIASAADTATALLCADKVALSCQVCTQNMMHRKFRLDMAAGHRLCDWLRLLGVFVLCCVSGRAEWCTEERLGVISDALDAVQRVAPSSDKSLRVSLAHMAEVLTWSLDMLYPRLTVEKQPSMEALKPKLPRWLPFIFDVFDPSAAKAATSPVTLLPPRWLSAMADAATTRGDAAYLENLLRVVRQQEERRPEYALFQLSASLADALVRRHPRRPSSADAVQCFGTALPCRTLSMYGCTNEGFEAAVRVLARMSGASPYFALQLLLRHRSTEEAATTQEKFGDLLTGNAHLNWRTALAFTMREAEQPNPQWRTYLPETLRLLSDAGQSKVFWNLLREYNAAEGTAQISVAASLGHVIRRSGKWWHAMEVVDLLTCARPPRNATEDNLLSSACSDTLWALLQHRRWQEALRIFLLVGNVLNDGDSAVVSRLLTSMPVTSPWETALATADAQGQVTSTVRAIVGCLHAGTSLALLPHSQQMATVPVLVLHGRWDLLCDLAKAQPNDAPVWHALLQAIGRCPDILDEAVIASAFTALPLVYWDDLSLWRAFGRVCIQRGWHSLLTAKISSARDLPASPARSLLCAELTHLINYLRHHRRPPTHFIFEDSYVVHQLLSCLSHQQVSILVRLPHEITSKERASAYLRVPLANLRPHGAKGIEDTVRAVSSPPCPFPSEHCIYASHDGLLVGYKVPSAQLFTTAAGMLRTLQSEAVYTLAYHMSPASSGLFLLCPATSSVTHYSIILLLTLSLMALPDAVPVPLFATHFFRKYKVRWRGKEGDRHQVDAEVVAANGQDAKTAWRSLKMALNAEGWGPVETEAGAGDTYHIARVSIFRRTVCGDESASHRGPEVIVCGGHPLEPVNGEHASVDE